jgi:hypothetical protein
MGAKSSKMDIFIPDILIEKGIEYFMISSHVYDRMKRVSDKLRFEAFHNVHYELVATNGNTLTRDTLQKSIDHVMKNKRVYIVLILVPEYFRERVKEYIQSRYPDRIEFKHTDHGADLRYARFFQNHDGCHVRFSESIEVMLANARKAD